MRIEFDLATFQAGIKHGVEDVELAMLRSFDAALKENNDARLQQLKTSLVVLRELFPDIVRS